MRIRLVILLVPFPVFCLRSVRFRRLSPLSWQRFFLIVFSLTVFFLISVPGSFCLPIIIFPVLLLHALRTPKLLDLRQLFTADLNRFAI